MLPVNPGTVMGHEFTGVVEEAGSEVTCFKPGDRVSAPPAVWCGICPACRRGEAPAAYDLFENHKEECIKVLIAP